MSMPVLNSTRIVERPSFETEVICFMSFRDFKACSSGWVTNPSMSAAETPMYGVETITSGMVMSGADSLGMEEYVL